MYRVLVNSFIRNVKAQQRIMVVGECFPKKPSIINKQLFRVMCTKGKKVDASQAEKSASEKVSFTCAKDKNVAASIADKSSSEKLQLDCKKINAKLVLNTVDVGSRNGDKNTAPQKKDDHTKIWLLERIVSASLAVIVPAALINPCPPLDVALAVAFVMHNFWAFESICADYINPSTFGTAVPKLVDFLVVILSVVTLAGLFCFIHDDVGIAQSFLCLWTVGQEDEDGEAAAGEVKAAAKDVAARAK